MKRVVRCALLLLTCGLTVLPPGWCCAAAKAVVAAAIPHQPAAPCCGCCPVETPDSDEPPAPPPARSWCCHRDPVVTARAADLDADHASVPLAAPLPAAPPAGRLELQRAGVLPPVPRLNVLHCTWLC